MLSPDPNDCQKKEPFTFGILFFSVMVLCLWILFFVLKAVQIPPETISNGSIMVMAEHIYKYYIDNGYLPNQNEYVEYRKMFPNVDDGWERPVKYVKRGPTEFLLYSLGRDNLIGGNGQDKDIVYIYNMDNDSIKEKSENASLYLDSSENIREGSTDDLRLNLDASEMNPQ